MRIAKACVAGLLYVSLFVPVNAGSSPWTAPLPQTKPNLSVSGMEQGATTASGPVSAPLPNRKPMLQLASMAPVESIELAVPAAKAEIKVPKTAKTQWDAGINAWRDGDFKASHELFAALAKGNGVTNWTRSGAAFWAARSADRMNDRRLAKGYLKLAAQDPQTFYGQLAGQIIREEPVLPSFARFKTLPKSLQGDVKGDAALIHAIIMQESRFNGKATSKMGARGLMQVMPATARHIEGRSFKGVEKLYDESYNVQVGSRYVQILAKDPHVQGHPHLLLAAYNGGPYNLQKWLRAMPDDVREDQLLVIESYPSGETRAFVERVMANMWVYERILNKRTSPSLAQFAQMF